MSAKMLLERANGETCVGNNVSATMCPRLPVPRVPLDGVESISTSLALRLDYQPLFGKGARTPPRHERAAEIEPTLALKGLKTKVVLWLSLVIRQNTRVASW